MQNLNPSLAKPGYLAAFHEWFKDHLNLWWFRQQLPWLHWSSKLERNVGLPLGIQGYRVLRRLANRHCSYLNKWILLPSPIMSKNQQNFWWRHCCCELSKALGEGVEIWAAWVGRAQSFWKGWHRTLSRAKSSPLRWDRGKLLRRNYTSITCLCRNISIVYSDSLQLEFCKCDNFFMLNVHETWQ